MRSRDRIDWDLQARRLDTDSAQLEVLLDIRDLLVQQTEGVGRCDHGNTGICMACVIRFDLLRVRP